MRLFRNRFKEKWESNWWRVQMLTIPEARDEALKLLADPRWFEIVEAESAAERFEDWAPELRAVLGRYQMIHSALGGGRLSWSQIRPLAANTGFTAIGSNETATVAARPSEDRIYEFDAEGNPPPYLSAPLPSLWHWIVWTDYVNRADATGIAPEQ